MTEEQKAGQRRAHTIWTRKARANKKAFLQAGGVFRLAAEQQPLGVLLDPDCREYLYAVHVKHDLFGPQALCGSTLEKCIETAAIYGA